LSVVKPARRGPTLLKYFKMPEQDDIIKTAALTKFYGATRGVEQVDLTLKAGEILGFLGPNGAGKTTTIRMLLGLILPTSGRATVLGRDIGLGLTAVMDRIGYIPGDVRLYPRMTGEYLLDYFARFKPRRSAKLRGALIERFGLDTDKRVGELSRGNRQKLAIVLALMHDPELLVLDEPTLGLDPLMQREFYQLLREFKKRGAALFLSTHILGEAENVCDHVAVVRDGRLIAVEGIDEIAVKKLHNLEVTVADDIADDFFDLPGVVGLQRQDRTFRLVFKGELDPLIKKLARAHVVSMNLSHAGLEEVFFEFYEKERGRAG